MSKPIVIKLPMLTPEQIRAAGPVKDFTFEPGEILFAANQPKPEPIGEPTSHDPITGEPRYAAYRVSYLYEMLQYPDKK